MRNFKRNAAVISAGAVLAALGLGGVMSAQAETPTTPGNPAVQQSDGDGELNEKAETGEDRGATAEAEEADDGPNRGPDADPNEPGHQDADESGEAQ